MLTTPIIFKKKFAITLINLTRRPDRLETVSEELKIFENTIPINIFPAIDGNMLKPSAELSYLFSNNDFGMRRGMVGCALSHLKIWKNMVDENIDYMLIFEDDIILCDKFEQELVECLNEDFDLLILGHVNREDNHLYDTSIPPSILNNPRLSPPSGEKKTFKQFKRHDAEAFSCGGFFGYILNKRCARLLLEFINTNGVLFSIDTIVKLLADTIVLKYPTRGSEMVYLTDQYAGTEFGGCGSDIHGNNDMSLEFPFSDIIGERIDYLKMI
jgi:GR25 family glycosyltransferase involved in LPS biosynthesis